MAQRRMFSNKIINSARFLKMPSSSQLLYFHLGLQADDDGVVEGYNVMRMTGSSEDDLKILVAKGFIVVLNEDLVSFITDWQEHNLIRADRKVDSIYKPLLIQMVKDVQLLESKERADLKKKDGQPVDVQWTDNGQHRLGKDSIGEDSIVKDKKVKTKYGEYKNVLLTEAEHEKLIKDYPALCINDLIEWFSAYIEEKGYKSKSHNLAIRRWVVEAFKNNKQYGGNNGKTGFTGKIQTGNGKSEDRTGKYAKFFATNTGALSGNEVVEESREYTGQCEGDNELY